MKFAMVLSLLYSVHCFGQVKIPTNAEGKYEYTTVVTVDSITQSDLFSNAKLYVTSAFKSGKDVTQLVDESTKTIVGKGWFTVFAKGFMYKLDLQLFFKLSIQCRDSRYKYSLTEFVVVHTPGGGSSTEEYPLEGKKPKGLTDKNWESIKEQVDQTMKLMTLEMQKVMASSKKNEW